MRGAPHVTVGVLGLTNPGIAIWDKANVEGRMELPGLVEQASKFVPELKRRGCDVVVVSAHSGADTSSSYGDALPWPENAASLVAEEVPGVDAILVGHAHKDIPARYVTNKKTGQQVLLTEPLYWGMRVAVMDLDLQHLRGRWQVTASHGQLLNSNTVDGDPAVLAAVRAQHDTVVDYVNSPIGTSAYSARYFKQVSGTGPFTMAQVTNAVTPTAPNGTPDYNFDSVAGFDAPLTYDIDISQPAGSRIVGLAYDGVAVPDGKEFAMAVNNYRQSGGGGFPHVSTAPVVYNRQNEIRQLLIDWVTANGTINPVEFASVDWRLVSGGQPITVS